MKTLLLLLTLTLSLSTSSGAAAGLHPLTLGDEGVERFTSSLEGNCARPFPIEALSSSLSLSLSPPPRDDKRRFAWHYDTDNGGLSDEEVESALRMVRNHDADFNYVGEVLESAVVIPNTPEERAIYHTIIEKVSHVAGLDPTHVPSGLRVRRIGSGKHIPIHADEIEGEDRVKKDALFTVLVYLTEAPSKANDTSLSSCPGCTVFDYASFYVAPKPGRIAIWRNVDRFGGRFTEGLHHAEPFSGFDNDKKVIITFSVPYHANYSTYPEEWFTSSPKGMKMRARLDLGPTWYPSCYPASKCVPSFTTPKSKDTPTSSTRQVCLQRIQECKFAAPAQIGCVGVQGESYKDNWAPSVFFSTSNFTMGQAMEWVGRGSVVNGVHLGDGGCQCMGYCGFKTKQACERSRFDPDNSAFSYLPKGARRCRWDKKKDRCRPRYSFSSFSHPQLLQPKKLSTGADMCPCYGTPHSACYPDGAPCTYDSDCCEGLQCSDSECIVPG